MFCNSHVLLPPGNGGIPKDPGHKTKEEDTVQEGEGSRHQSHEGARTDRQTPREHVLMKVSVRKTPQEHVLMKVFIRKTP